MIKVPATPEGLPAISTLISGGVNVNATQVFSLQQYAGVADAYLTGLERRAGAGGNLSEVTSVASLVVNRIDTAIDRRLPYNSPLRGRIAIANARVVYAQFRRMFRSHRFDDLQRLGGRVQRLLWAGTSVKDAAYRDLMYAENLIGPLTVSAMSPATIAAFRHRGRPQLGLAEDPTESIHLIGQLGQYGIDFDAVTRRLSRESVEALTASFDSLMGTLEAKRRLAAQTA
jgi:transaldolase